MSSSVCLAEVYSLELTQQISLKQPRGFGSGGDFYIQNGKVLPGGDNAALYGNADYCTLSVQYSDQDFEEELSTGKYPELALQPATIQIAVTSQSLTYKYGASTGTCDMKSLINPTWLDGGAPYVGGLSLVRADGKITTTKATALYCYSINVPVQTMPVAELTTRVYNTPLKDMANQLQLIQP